MNYLHVLIAVMIALQFLDVLSTAYIIDRMGGMEQNRIMSWVMDRMGIVPGMLMVKSAMITVILFTVFYFHKLPLHSSETLVGLIDLFYIVVVARNLVFIARK